MPYTFGEDQAFYQNALELGRATWTDTRNIAFPKDMVFIDRTLSGLFGNLCRLRATGPWRSVLQHYVNPRLKMKAKQRAA